MPFLCSSSTGKKKQINIQVLLTNLTCFKAKKIYIKNVNFENGSENNLRKLNFIHPAA